MDVRSIVDVEPEVEHNGTVPVWYLVHPREMKAITEGGSLELVNEFEVANGGYVYPHSHPTHEFYFVMSGRGVMTIADEDRCHREVEFVDEVRGQELRVYGAAALDHEPANSSISQVSDEVGHSHVFAQPDDCRCRTESSSDAPRFR